MTATPKSLDTLEDIVAAAVEIRRRGNHRAAVRMWFTDDDGLWHASVDCFGGKGPTAIDAMRAAYDHAKEYA